jgi:hypothetical protein
MKISDIADISKFVNGLKIKFADTTYKFIYVVKFLFMLDKLPNTIFQQ